MALLVRLTAVSLVLVCASTCCATNPPSFKRVNEVALDHVAVATLDYNFPGGEPALILTTFFPFGKDGVYCVPNVTSAFEGKQSSLKISTIDDTMKWPNQANSVAQGTIVSAPNASFLLTASGFFVSPGKATGSISLLDISKFPYSTKTTVSVPEKNYFYHHAVFHDVNGDGRKDILAARAYKSSLNPFAKSKTNLVWLEQPEGDFKNNGNPWVERQITGDDGPGVGFTLCDLDNDNQMEVVASQFFAKQQLSLWWCDSPEGHWSDCTNGTNVGSAVIDAAEGAPFFNVEWVDLNNDGKKDLLATTNTANGKGAVFAYEQPADFKIKDAKWTVHRLADGYKPTKAFLPGRGAPGTAKSFFVNKKTDKLPSILVSGDDAGYYDLLVPRGDSPFQYEKIRMANSTGTVGTPAVSDLDGDGFAEVVLPLFAENKIAFYKFE